MVTKDMFLKEPSGLKPCREEVVLQSAKGNSFYGSNMLMMIYHRNKALLHELSIPSMKHFLQLVQPLILKESLLQHNLAIYIQASGYMQFYSEEANCKKLEKKNQLQ